MSVSSSIRGDQSPDAAHRAGVLVGLLTYLMWGLLPLYLKQFVDMPPTEVLAHRIVWSVATLVLLVGLLRGGKALKIAFANRKILRTLVITALLISLNWLVYIYSVSSGLLLQASLGYFINPLVNVLFGFLFLRESLTTRQIFAIGCAVAGVGILIVGAGEFPIIGLTLAFSFGTYALLRKTIQVDGITGLFIESLIIGPIALGYLLWLEYQGTGHFAHDGLTRDILLVCAGPVTAIPLVLFGFAVQRVRLSTMGLMQYIAPTGQFLLAIFLYGETFTVAHGWAFSCIWMGLAIYSIPRDVLARIGLRSR